eukprot:GEMP01000602.1.p1 GENE.GEMP01000602.1~~GEMP01000602.1.p1  ORF type:complete len:1314 (+),score=299.15 GEMP01000602.1:210-4151(+)
MELAPKGALAAFREARAGASRIDQVEKKIDEEQYEYVDETTMKKLETEYKDVDISSSEEDEQPAPKRVRRDRQKSKAPEVAFAPAAQPAAPSASALPPTGAVTASMSPAPATTTSPTTQGTPEVPRKPDVIPAHSSRSSTPSTAAQPHKPQIRRASLDGRPQASHNTRRQSLSGPVQPAYRPNNLVVENTPSNFMPPLDEKGAFWFYYLDVHEETLPKSGTKVMLFGKIIFQGRYRNCCVVVDNMMRNVFFILAQQGDIDDFARNSEMAASEVTRVRTKLNASERFYMKPVKRFYPFEKELPFPHGLLQCLKVRYSFKTPAIPSNSRGEHFCQVFGTHTPALELLLKKRRIKGPMWMKIKVNGASVKSRDSHCPFEVHIDDHKSIESFSRNKNGQCGPMRDSPVDIPPLQVLTMGMKSRSQLHGKEEYHEPIVVTMNYHPEFKADATNDQLAEMERELFHFAFTLDAPPMDTSALPNTLVHQCPNEVELLQRIIDRVAVLDPDIIVQHNAYGFGLDVLAQRLQARNMNNWHRLSRLNKPELLGNRRMTGFFGGRKLTVGRLVCDTLLCAREFLGKQSNYEMETLATSVLNEPNFTGWNRNFPGNDVTQWKEYLLHTLMESQLTFRLLGRLQAIPLTKQLTNLAGNVWNHSLQNKRAERNEYLLMHAFYDEKAICPDKESKFKGNDDEGAVGGKQKSKAAYSGGLVLEPKAGLYDDLVMMLDFNSLYPSIIQEYNICFTTVQRPRGDHVNSMVEEELLNQTEPPKNLKDEGILPRVIRRLVSARRTIKDLMKSERDPRVKAQMEIKQKAIKLTANSMYGCLGFAGSRFYAKPLAALITARGRHVLQNTVDMVTNQLKFEVVYGDTDSVFIRSFTKEYSEALQAAQNIKHQVNKQYQKLEIDVDGIFVRLLLLKKKKYAGIKVSDWAKGEFENEYKGLDLVRRDWCGLSKRLGKEILAKVLSNTPLDEAVEWVHEYLRTMSTEIDEKKVPVEEFVITKALTKHPNDYPDAKGQPHVQVALRMLKNGEMISTNQEIPYIICKTGDASMALCARHPHEVANDPSLEIDLEWYKKQQLHPPIFRLLGPVQGTDACKIAECLGLDAARFQVAEIHEYTSDVALETMLDPASRFRQLDLAFDILCPHCKERIALRETLQVTEKLELKEEAEGDAQCPKCNEFIDPIIVSNQSALGVRQLLDRYAACETRCTEPTCNNVSRDVGLRGLGQRCEILKCKARCEKTFGEKDLQNQLDLLEYMFSIANDNSANENAYARGKKYVDGILEHSEYNWIRKDFFASIFTGLNVSQQQQPLTDGFRHK